MNKFATILFAHKFGILARYDFRTSTGKLESINNKIKTMKRLAYEFRDRESFNLKILSLHKKNYAFSG
jgi:transposase